MPITDDVPEHDKGANRVFATTHWTVVMAAADTAGGEAEAALAELCETYWFPLYAFVRRFGHTAEDARDLTQEFFHQLLTKKTYKVADRQRGRFRTFLLTSLKNFLANEHEKAHRQKRAGSATHFSLDFQDAEGRYLHEPSHAITPERMFEREWAKALLDRVLTRLRNEFVATGQGERFDVLSAHLVQPEDGDTLVSLAGELKLSHGAVKVAMHRLRTRFRTVCREEIAILVGGVDEVDGEVKHLFTMLG
jgi:RNA polymerase sigma factor (sigma-70 family)